MVKTRSHQHQVGTSVEASACTVRTAFVEPPHSGALTLRVNATMRTTCVATAQVGRMKGEADESEHIPQWARTGTEMRETVNASENCFGSELPRPPRCDKAPCSICVLRAGFFGCDICPRLFCSHCVDDCRVCGTCYCLECRDGHVCNTVALARRTESHGRTLCCRDPGSGHGYSRNDATDELDVSLRQKHEEEHVEHTPLAAGDPTSNPTTRTRNQGRGNSDSGRPYSYNSKRRTPSHANSEGTNWRASRRVSLEMKRTIRHGTTGITKTCATGTTRKR